MKKGRRSGPFSFARLAGRRLKGASINTNPQVRNRDLLPFILACLAMIGPFSIDTYLPAFPAMVASLGAT
jgi:hypothetical protein